MNQNKTESKPASVEDPREKGLDETTCCASSVCDYVPNSNEPCADCPRKITMLYRCGLLQEAAAEVRTEGSAKTAEERAELESAFTRRISGHNDKDLARRALDSE